VGKKNGEALIIMPNSSKGEYRRETRCRGSGGSAKSAGVDRIRSVQVLRTPRTILRAGAEGGTDFDELKGARKRKSSQRITSVNGGGLFEKRVRQNEPQRNLVSQ